jgi:ADP-heptose:LPS heptosyltransferase
MTSRNILGMKLFHPKQPLDLISKPELGHVLVIQLDGTGSLVMLSPALRTLREALPDAQLTLMTSSAGSQIAPLLPWVDNVMVDRTLESSGSGTRSINPRDDVAFVECMRQHNFSIAFIFTSASQSPIRAAYACYLAGIPYRVAFANETIGSVLSHSFLPPADNVHQVDRNLELLKTMGLLGVDQRMELKIPVPVESRASELLRILGVNPSIPYIVLAPGFMGTLNTYDPNHFAAVAHILAAQTDQQLLIVGSSAEAKMIQPVLQAARENVYGNIFSLVEKITLPELAAIIRHASLIIANNSVSMQFADVFECPMVILHSETDIVSQWMPRHASVRLLSRPAICSYCSQADCPNRINCPDVRPEEIAIAALEMLSEQTQTFEPPAYREILSYKIDSDIREQTTR